MATTQFTDYSIHQTIVNMIKSGYTGSLMLQPGSRKLFFENGGLVYASSEVENESFSNILLELGVIDEGKLREVQATLQPGQSLGKKLRDEGLADAPSLAKALKQQIMRIVQQVANTKSGQIEQVDGPIPPKTPKLKIHTQPLFLKSCLLIEDPVFPSHITDEALIQPHDNFEPSKDTLNLPISYRELLDHVPPEGTNMVDWQANSLLEMAQVKRLAYILDLLELATLSIPTEVMSLSEDDMFMDVDDLDDGALEIVEEPGPDYLNQASADVTFSDLGLPIEDEPSDDLLDPESMHFTGDGDTKPDLLLSQLEDTPAQEEPDLGSALSDDPDYDPLDETTRYSPEEDPVEALNRALNTSGEEVLDSFDLEDVDDASDTVPSTPVNHLLDDDGPDFSDYDAAEVLDDDQGITAPMDIPSDKIEEWTQKDTIKEIPVPELPKPPEIQPSKPEEETLRDRGFILPERDPDAFQHLNKKSKMPLLIGLLVLVALGAAGFFTKDMWLPLIAGKDSQTQIDPLVDSENQTLEPDEIQDDTNQLALDSTQIEPQNEQLENQVDDFQDAPVEEPQTLAVKTTTPEPQATKEPEPQIEADPIQKRPETEVTEKVDLPPPQDPSGHPFEQDIRRTRNEISVERARYSIAFIVACEPATINSLKRESNEAFGILPRRLGARNCTIGIWGYFQTKEEAQMAIGQLPRVLGRGERGWIIDLNKY